MDTHSTYPDFLDNKIELQKVETKFSSDPEIYFFKGKYLNHQLMIKCEFPRSVAGLSAPVERISFNLNAQDFSSFYSLLLRNLGEPTTEISNNACYETGYSWLLINTSNYSNYKPDNHTIKLIRKRAGKDAYEFIALNNEYEFRCDSTWAEDLKKFNEKIDRENFSTSGKGNGKFNTNVSLIQNVILKQLTLKYVENTLHHWWNHFTDSTFLYNKHTKQFDIFKCYRSNYQDCIKENGSDGCNSIWISYSKNKKVISITTQVSDSYLLYHLIPQLKSAGYIFTEANYNRYKFTEAFGAGTISVGNKYNKITATISPSQYGMYNFTMEK